MRTYIFDPAWERECERLASIEELWDSGTIAHLESLGVSEGWRCLEVGAGGGSIVGWLADRVGLMGEVLATDVDTRFLEQIQRVSVEVKRHDILTDRLPEGRFDLVHARLVLEHLADRDLALERMIAALRPGGWLLVEDYDWSSGAAHPPLPIFSRVQEATLGFMAGFGYDPYYGRTLAAELKGHGLCAVQAEGRCRMLTHGSPGADFYRLGLEQLRAALVEAGALTDDEISEALQAMGDRELTVVTPIVVAAWGQRRA